MARKRIRLSQFEVEGAIFEEGADLVHHYRRCTWRISAVGRTPMELVWESRDHARECDGKPQPRPDRPPSADPGLVPAAWSADLMAALSEGVTRRGGDLEAYIAEFHAATVRA